MVYERRLVAVLLSHVVFYERIWRKMFFSVYDSSKAPRLSESVRRAKSKVSKSFIVSRHNNSHTPFRVAYLHLLVEDSSRPRVYPKSLPMALEEILASYRTPLCMHQLDRSARFWVSLLTLLRTLFFDESITIRTGDIS
jgi:hypothetical protein